MKYKTLWHILRFLMYVKRFFWWIGAGLYSVLAKISSPFVRFGILVRYKTGYTLKRAGFGQSGGFFLKRDFLQIALFLILFTLTATHTTLFSKRDLAFSLQSTAAYAMISTDEESNLEVVLSQNNPENIAAVPSWRDGALTSELNYQGTAVPQSIVLTTPVAGGGAFFKPSILPGSSLPTSAYNQDRTEEVPYTVESGDTLSTIAYQFGVSIPTIMWNNGLTLRSIIRPGDTLKIPPTTGVMHLVRKGDTVKKIATLYDAKTDDIIAFNRLRDNGSSLKAGERIMVPDGIKPEQKAVATAKTSKNYASFVNKIATPPASVAASSRAGFIWPSGSHTITQYFNAGHHAIDIGGPWQTPTYAAKAGVVEKAQCGWNGGYGCYVIIDHGGGIKTLYGHHSVLLVQPGEAVAQGQVIALMGNTGNVRGLTGIHLHFEVIVSGVRVNPLGYVR